MPETTFTFRVEEKLKNTFAKAAKAQDRSAAQLLRALMREAVERGEAERAHDAWFRAEVEKGLREADHPNTRRISHEEVTAKRRRWRAEVVKRARAKNKKRA